MMNAEEIQVESAEERSRIERQQIVEKYDKGPEGAKIDDWENPTYDHHKTDRFGFIHDENLPDIKQRTEQEWKQIALERSREQKWAEMLGKTAFASEKRSQQRNHYFEPNAKYREKMINRIYKGVPDSMRGELWAILLRIDELKRQQEGVYNKMKRIARIHSPDIRQIDLDVNRTYRDHEFFKDRYNARQQALFHVLAAYSVYNTEVGYCQGMSQIAALLLMYLLDEEDAFWGLHQLMNDRKYAMHGFFIHGFPKLMRFQQHHDKVMKKFLPKLKKHLDRQGIDSGIYTLKWFFQCFLDRIPFSLTLRTWDLFLLEGDRVLIAMAYTILWLHRKKLMKMQMDEAIEYLQIVIAQGFGYDDDTVIGKLRENMHDLRSNRLDHPGKPPPEELPERPFGLLIDYPEYVTEIPKHQKPKEWTEEKEAGLRKGFTDKEREFSQKAMLRQQQNHIQDQEDIDEEDIEDDTTGHGNSYDDSSGMRPLRSTSTAGGQGGQDFDTSFDTSDIINGDAIEEDDDADVVQHFIESSPLPPSKELDYLNSSFREDNLSIASDLSTDSYREFNSSLRDMLKVASDLSCDKMSSSSEKMNKRPRSHIMDGTRNTSNRLETSFDSYFPSPGNIVERSASNSDVVRIKVPYSREDALQRVQDENKIRITVNNHGEKTGQNGNSSSSPSKSRIIKSNSKSMTNL